MHDNACSSMLIKGYLLNAFFFNLIHCWRDVKSVPKWSFNVPSGNIVVCRPFKVHCRGPIWDN